MDIERKFKDNTFYYVKNNKIIKNEKILERIKKLVIPPAWRDVKIANHSDEKIQCTGYDDKGRKQYKYNVKFIKEQSDIKYFDTLIKFGKKINIIRHDIERILRKRIWDLEKTTAFVIFIIDKCHLRVGNEKYKDDNESYGITTLEKKHIIIKSTSIYINFIGKKSIENKCRFRESRMLSLFKSLDKEFNPKENDSFFKYYGHNNSIYTINSCHINDFLKQYGDFSAKNFRTWTANEYIVKYLYNMLSELSKQEDLNSLSERNLSIIINKAVDLVSEQLNNTRVVCKKSYILNDIFIDLKKNSQAFLEKLKHYGKSKLKNSNGLESILLKLLLEYRNN
tara:strand:- start:27 stop:1040 length:1014 start_codon:yes stop_codon:yes gene_type:complete